MMTELHEKKVSELDYIVGNVNMEANPEEGIPKRILREWAIAVVKNCNGYVYFNPEYSDNGKEITRDKCGHLNCRCDKCEFLIECFNITKDDLK